MKFLNTLPPELSKFVTDVKLVRDRQTTNVDQFHAYLGQHEYHANEDKKNVNEILTAELESYKYQSLEIDNLKHTLSEHLKEKKSLEQMNSGNSEEPNLSTSTTKVKVPKELPKVSMTYKQLYDSIKSSRVQSKEQCDALIKQVNIKSAEKSDLNASLQEKALVITALKDTLSKLKGKAIVNEAVTLHPIDLELL
nr:hypothetical protein [Tanacetum cinerariifolium]